MYPYLRLMRVIAHSKTKKKIDFHNKEFDSIRMRVWPQDIDPFFELNNGRYVTLLDLGRFAFGARVKINQFLAHKKWSLTITGTYNEYRYRLRLFQRFTIQTQVIGYDENWFYFFQKLVRKDKTHMASIVKFSFTSKNGIVKPKEVMEAYGEVYEPTNLPKWITEIGSHQIFKK